MLLRRLLTCAVGVVVAGAGTLGALPAYATGSLDVYVATPANGGDDAQDCSSASPCAGIARALLAVADGGTIHVGAGTFDGPVRPGALSKSVTISGLSPVQTTLTASSGSQGYDGTVVESYGTTVTTLSNLTVSGGDFAGVSVADPAIVHADHVTLTDGGCDLLVTGGSVDLTDSVVGESGLGGCATPPNADSADIYLDAGQVSLVRTRVLGASDGENAVEMFGGTLTADQSLFDDSAHDVPSDSSGLKIHGGMASIARSTFHGWGYQGVRVAGGQALVSDDTFQGNLVGVNVDSGSALVVRSTFQHELASVQGPVSVAGSVLGSVSASYGIEECNGVITDLGYNLSTDHSCGFNSPTSHQDVADLNLDTGLADRGGPVQTVAILNPSAAVDAIPSGATYGVSATPLCAGTTDIRGVSRPQGGGCDAGSMEMVATTTTLRAPSTAKPSTAVKLYAMVTVEDSGVDGIEAAHGSITFLSGTHILCQHATVTTGTASCTTSALAAGRRQVTATFTPDSGTTLHASFSVSRAIRVGTKPVFTSARHSTFVVGKTKTFRLHAHGSPSPRITLVRGKLPAGLSFHAGNGIATVSGKAKASAVGTHRITLQATNLRSSVRRVLRIVIHRS